MKNFGLPTFLPPAIPLLLAHRGYSSEFPENTALAFNEALKAGADGVECDIQRTRDGRYVVLHDDTVTRTAVGYSGDRVRVDELDCFELKQIEVGGGEKIITLEEFLELIPPSRYVNIEAKKETLQSGDVVKIAKIINAARSANAMVSSFEHDLLIPAREAGLETGMLIGDEHAKLGPTGLLREVMRVRPSHLNLPFQLFERISAGQARALLVALRATGRRIFFWTINEELEYRKIAGWVDGVITDRVPDAMHWIYGDR